MENLITRKNQFCLLAGIYLAVAFLGTLFTFITSYFVVNLESEQTFKFCFLPVTILFIAVNFLLVIFFMDYSKFKLEQIPSWWFLFYISFFIPYFNHFVPLILFLVFLGKDTSTKNKVIISILNFIPFFSQKLIRLLISVVLKKQITDKIVLMSLNYFLQESVKWIIIMIILNKIIDIEKEAKEILAQ